MDFPWVFHVFSRGGRGSVQAVPGGFSHGFSMDFSCFFPGEDEDQYEQFMLPLTAAFEAVAQMFSTNSFNEQEAKVSGVKIPNFPAFPVSFPWDLGIYGLMD